MALVVKAFQEISRAVLKHAITNQATEVSPNENPDVVFGQILRSAKIVIGSVIQFRLTLQLAHQERIKDQ